jgi:hypothetical protein
MIHLAISPSSIHPPSSIPLTSPTPALRLSTTRDNRHGRRITALRPPIGDLDTLPLISRVISDGAICGGTHDALAANQTVWAEPSAQSPQPLPEGVKGRLRQLLLQYYVQHLMFSRCPSQRLVCLMEWSYIRPLLPWSGWHQHSLSFECIFGIHYGPTVPWYRLNHLQDI